MGGERWGREALYSLALKSGTAQRQKILARTPQKKGRRQWGVCVCGGGGGGREALHALSLKSDKGTSELLCRTPLKRGPRKEGPDTQDEEGPRMPKQDEEGPDTQDEAGADSGDAWRNVAPLPLKAGPNNRMNRRT